MTIPSPISAFNYSSPSPADTNVQEFTSSGQWVKPPGCNVVIVEAWGAGAGGGSGARQSIAGLNGGLGGGGGAYATRTFKASDLPSTVVVTVGAGGLGGQARTTNGSNNAGTDGGNSSFGDFLTTYGGLAINTGGGVLGRGLPSSNTTSQIAGAFGPSAVGSSTAIVGAGFAGGNGGRQTLTTPSLIPGGSSFQGGAGGAAGGFVPSSGNTSSLRDVDANGGGISGDGGTGGLSGTLTSVNGQSGSNPRDGGGGGTALYSNATGGGIYYLANSSTNWLGLLRPSTAAGFWSIGGTSLSGNASFNVTDLNSNLLSTMNFNLGSLIHDGTSWVLCGRGVSAFSTNSYIWSSSNGIDWTLKYTETNAIVANCIAYASGTYVIVGNSGSIKTSTDLITWTTRTSGTSNILLHVIHDGSRWIAVGNNGVTLTSTDSVSWTVVTIGAAGVINCVASSGSTIVVAASNTPFAWRSTDNGATWLAVSTTLTGTASARVLFANSTFVLSANSIIWSSTDGSTWTLRTDGTTDTYGQIIYFDSRWFVSSVTVNSTARCGLTSTDTVTWSSVAMNTYSGNGGSGANGRFPGGGGGGGAAAVQPSNSGAGGNGGNGLVRVYSI